MRQLNSTQTAIYVAGALLMVIGAGATLLGWAASPYIYSIGALAFTYMQTLQSYDGTSVTIRRLRRIMLLSDALFLVAAVLMFASIDNLFSLPWMFYVQYVYRKWVIVLLIAAILQLYTTHRIGGELEREAKKR